MTQPLVECEGLVHIYKTAELEVVALQGLDLRVEAGEMVAIAGRSGSGKTTLMNLLAGVEPPSAGAARVAGHDLARMDDRVRPAQLTGAESQRLALAVARANEPRLLLADEPTAELDGANARELLDDLTSLLRDLGTAAIMVTHDQQLERHVDRVIQIRDGRTSTERRWLARPNGEREVADELVILDRAGRLQLPQAHVEKLGLRDRVRVHLDGDSIRIMPEEKSPDADS